jgi:hypothetical protein
MAVWMANSESLKSLLANGLELNQAWCPRDRLGGFRGSGESIRDGRLGQTTLRDDLGALHGLKFPDVWKPRSASISRRMWNGGLL